MEKLFEKDQIPTDLLEYFEEVTPDPIPCTVGDIFMGSGTSGLVSEKLSRKWIGIEINPEYCEIAKDRIEIEAKQAKLFCMY